MGETRHASDAPLVGKLLLDRYQVLERINRGVSSELYRAEDRQGSGLVACKVLRTSVVLDEEICERFRREAQLLVRLQHPNIVHTRAYGELSSGDLFIVMDFVVGTRLDLLLQRSPMEPAEAIRLALQCADALRYAHGLNVVHRDFKPSNVMVTAGDDGEPQARILDFGAARMAEMEELTPVGAIVGTLGYLSPEQCLGEVATPASDQYALGLVLYEMLSGRKAIEGDSPLDFLQLNEHRRIAPLEQLCGNELARRASPAVMRMLALRVADRFSDLEQASAALAALLVQRAD